MKTIAKIILIAMVIAFGMQSTAIAELRFKSPGEIAKNVGKRIVKKAQEDPEKTKEFAEKVTGTDEDEGADSAKKKEGEESAENKK